MGAWAKDQKIAGSIVSFAADTSMALTKALDVVMDAPGPRRDLGNLRSQGIQDLRHGNIVEADWQGRQCPDDTADCRQVTRLSRRGRHWLIGATRDAQAPADPWAARGDDLVPLASALGLCAQGRHALDGPAVERRVLADTGHLALLSAPQVQPLLREALQLDPS